MVESARKSGHINTSQEKQFYAMAEKGKSVQEIKNHVYAVRKGAKISELKAGKSAKEVCHVVLRMDFFKKDVGPDKDLFAEKLRARIYKQFKFKNP